MKAAPGGESEQSNDLRALTASWEDVQQTRLALVQRGLLPAAAEMEKLEDRLGRAIKKEMTRHPLADWFPKGLGGVHVARLVALIEDPHRFPGRRCTVGHYMPYADPADELDRPSGVGDPCPTETHDGPCEGTLLPPRAGTGVRSLWHYCGLHVVDGRSPRKTKGKVVDWNPIARTIVLMPGGIAEQIVRLRVPKYRETYDATKARLTETRAVPGDAIEGRNGASLIEGAEVDGGTVNDHPAGLRPFQIDAIARKVAAKQFIGDLLMEWKRRSPATAGEIELGDGRAA